MANILHYIALPFGYLMKFCCWISPGHNYIVALIFFTIIIQVLLCLIFGIKQQKNMQKQARLAPKAAAIRKKYAGRNDNVTKQKMQQEIMALYFFENRSMSEIAALLDVNKSTVSRCLRRGQERLRHFLEYSL